MAPRTALILSGGGARAAYQVGVLAAIRDLLPDSRKNPFPVICGTSAGAINAAYLASNADDFGLAVGRLQYLWRNFHADHIYRTDTLAIGGTIARWLALLTLGWLIRENPRALLDNTPLRRLLEQHIDFARIDEAIANQSLHSISITCSGYASGHSVSFFQGRADLEPWQRAQRIGAHVKLGLEHLLASSAIPFVFPAVRVNREFFGDGSMRQVAPISPAIRLGADKIMVVGAGRMAASEGAREAGEDYPSLAQIAGHALSSIFLDNLYADIERAMRINRTLSVIPEELRQKSGLSLRPIELLVISPSERLDYLAAEHAGSLPWPVRMLLRGLGAINDRGGALTSYLLFERSYTRALIALGRRDTLARSEEVRAFLEN